MTTDWKHGNIISQMSLEEKAATLNGASEWTTREIRRLGIEALVFSDGPNGVRRQRGKGDHLGLNASVPATCFPALSALACSWDEALLYRVGQALGTEARTLGVDVLLGPGLNIRRNPAGGRNFEYFSEDPYLSGKEAAAFIRGIQSTGISACPKHFAVNSQELHRMTVDSVLDERALRELYLTGFEIALKEGGAHAIMTSYNKVNGSYANENTHLLLEILRKEWKYDGFVVTDWGGCNDPAKGAACRSDLSMPGAGYVPVHEIVQAVLDSRLPMEALEQCVEDTLELQRKTAPGRKNRAAGYDPEKHHILARKAAAQSVVLLKNQGKPSRLLPLSENTRAALIGAFGSSPRYQGAGSSAVNPSRLESLSQVIGNYLPRYTGYAAGYTPGRKRDPAKERKALSLAEKSELILYCMGLDECSELEGRDRKNLAIPEEQILLLQKLYEVNPNIVVLLSAGAAVDLWWENYCSGIVYGQLGGQAGASAILEILLGKICPSGRLSETWPLRYEDTPSYGYFPGPERTAEYRESIFVGYRYYHSAQIRVRYPFGYGLSYTSFSYSDLKTDDRGVSFEIRNTGDRDGAEVAQLYVGIKKSRVFRAARELKGFHKVFLRAGEKTTVKIPFDEKTFRFWNTATASWEREEGEYTVCIGASAEDIRLEDRIFLKGTTDLFPEDQNLLPSYCAAAAAHIPQEEFESLLGRPLPASGWSGELSENDALCQMHYAESRIARFFCRLIRVKTERMRKPDMSLLFVYNLPFRGIARMTQGVVDSKMVDGILEFVNGRPGKGLKTLFSGMLSNRKRNRAYRKAEDLRNRSAGQGNPVLHGKDEP